MTKHRDNERIENKKYLDRMRKERMDEISKIVPTSHAFCSGCINYYKNKCEGKMAPKCKAGLDTQIENTIKKLDITDKERLIYKNLKNPVDWAKIMFNWEARYYQKELLLCSAQKKVVRAGRRIGKTATLAIDALFRAITMKDQHILIICPFQEQVTLVFQAIRDHIQKSDGLIKPHRDIGNPQRIEFKDGDSLSYILGITAGTRTGMKGDKARGQDATALYLDEADYLDQATLESLLAIFASKADCFLWASSTPTGQREMFYDWCLDKETHGFKEFHYPSNVSPEWTLETEEHFREMYSEHGYLHEFTAEFGESETSIYQKHHIDSSLVDYVYDTCSRNPDRQYLYSLGVDWNTAKNGVHLVGVEYNPHTYKMKVVLKEVIHGVEYTQIEAVERIIKLNDYWRFDSIYVDQGFGDMQIEQLHKYGTAHPRSKLGEIVKGISMRESIEIKDPFSSAPLKKNAKHLMVTLTAGRVEVGQCVLPKFEDTRGGLVYQIRNFRAERFSRDQIPVYSGGDDHAITAWQLAIFALVIEFTSITKYNHSTKVKFADVYNKFPTPEEVKVYNKAKQRKRRDLEIVPRVAPLDKGRGSRSDDVRYEHGRFIINKTPRPNLSRTVGRRKF